ncbi:MAG TPA: methanogenesis marker 3 protein, partial [Candidatus Methanomethylicus sp.]|nr:methanogenesis marker 3 protein [Candidatus Methanomethylicus sp.]
DKIIKIEPIIEMKEAAKSVLKIDGDYALEDGDSVITKMRIELEGASPASSEHVYNVLGKGWLEVRSRTSRFISDNRVGIASLATEWLGVRQRGTLTVRNTGGNAGGIYVYTSEAPLSASHSIAGHVVSGMELADVSEEGDRIAVSISQERIDLLGKTQSEAEAFLAKLGIKVERQGDSANSAIVVEHSPSNSLEIVSKKEVQTIGAGRERIVKIRLYAQDAPASVRYFRVITGLELRRFGKLKTYFSTPKMDMILFKGNEDLAKGLMPENIPSSIVKSGQIGVTNTVKKFTGMIGVRFTNGDKFGPTAEAFDGTNLIGEVAGNMEALRELKEGTEIYIQEVR